MGVARYVLQHSGWRHVKWVWTVQWVETCRVGVDRTVGGYVHVEWMCTMGGDRVGVARYYSTHTCR